jgi:hypothetical protein
MITAVVWMTMDDCNMVWYVPLSGGINAVASMAKKPRT